MIQWDAGGNRRGGHAEGKRRILTEADARTTPGAIGTPLLALWLFMGKPDVRGNDRRRENSSAPGT